MAKVSPTMCEGPFLKKIILYTIPIALTGMLQLAFNAADLMIVGQFCGSFYVGAVGATSSLTTLFVSLFMGFSVGSGVAVAQSIGAGNDKITEQTVHTAIPLAIVCGVILTGLGIQFSDTLLRWMGTPEQELAYSTLYMKIHFCGTTASLLYNFCAAILRASGDTKSPLLFLTISGITNVGLNTLFVTAFDMNVDGVAWATVLSQYLSAVLVLIALTHRKDACRLTLKNLRFHKEPLKKILRIGLPSGLQTSLFSISNVLIQSSVNSFGSVFLAGNTAANNLGGFVYTSMSAVYQSALNFTGQNYGARKFENIRKISWICLGVVFTLGLVEGAIVTLLGEPLLGIYIKDSPQAVQYGMIRLCYIVLPYFLGGMMEVTTGLLRGMGTSFLPMIISLVGVCGFRVFWIFSVLPLQKTPEMLYISYPISWLFTFSVQYTVFRIVMKKKERQINQRIQ
ncbi:MAG: MATE family efflux transporter [Clostridia bacterium]|nr:MATE family efflux transporter [Clostridia bacterium]